MVRRPVPLSPSIPPGAPPSGTPSGVLDAAAFERLMAPLGPFEAAPVLAVAVSGGRDSMALALLADAWARARGGAVVALTVDHALRRESAAEAAQVAAWMAARGIAHETLVWTGDKPATGIQEAARDARHRLLAAACRRRGLLHLCLAHQRDDQAETLLFRLAHGSGPDGLAGMAPVRHVDDVRLLRPLLDVPRATLTATCLGFGQAWIDDPGNTAPRYARGRLRAAEDARAALGLGDAILAATARRSAAARASLEGAAAAALARHAALFPEGYALVDAALLHRDGEVRRRVLTPLLVAVGGQPHPPRWEEVERLSARLSALAPGRSATLGGCAVRRLGGGRLLLTREEGRVAPPRPLAPGEDSLWDGRFLVRWRRRPESPISPLQVGALGTAAARRIMVEEGAAPSVLPKAVLATLPALWRDGALMGVPHLGWWADAGVAAYGGGDDPDLSLRLRPPSPVAEAGFFSC